MDCPAYLVFALYGASLLNRSENMRGKRLLRVYLLAGQEMQLVPLQYSTVVTQTTLVDKSCMYWTDTRASHHALTSLGVHVHLPQRQRAEYLLRRSSGLSICLVVMSDLSAPLIGDQSASWEAGTAITCLGVDATFHIGDTGAILYQPAAERSSRCPCIPNRCRSQHLKLQVSGNNMLVPKDFNCVLDQMTQLAVLTASPSASTSGCDGS